MVKIVKAKKERPRLPHQALGLPRNDKEGKEDGLLCCSAPRNDGRDGCNDDADGHNDKNEGFVDKYNLGGRPKSFKSPQEMIELMTAYFDKQKNIVIGYTKDGVSIYWKGPINIQGLCAFMGITNQTLNEYAKNKAYKYIITQAKAICEAHLVDLCCLSKDHKADFVLKNNYKEDWKDETSTKLVSDEPTAERLKKFLDKNKGSKTSKKQE